MAAKKDFTKVNTNPLYSALEDATTDILPGQMEIKSIDMALEEAEARKVQAALDAQEETRKARRTYTNIEKAVAMDSMSTSGRKGVKLPRINMAFTPANYEFIKTMAKVRGESMTDFINHVLELSRETNADLYEQALEFRNNLK